MFETLWPPAGAAPPRASLRSNASLRSQAARARAPAAVCLARLQRRSPRASQRGAMTLHFRPLPNWPGTKGPEAPKPGGATPTGGCVDRDLQHLRRPRSTGDRKHSAGSSGPPSGPHASPFPLPCAPRSEFTSRRPTHEGCFGARPQQGRGAGQADPLHLGSWLAGCPALAMEGGTPLQPSSA